MSYVYADFEDEFDPTLVTMPLALPHQLRDWVSNRDDADGIRESGPLRWHHGDLESAVHLRRRHPPR